MALAQVLITRFSGRGARSAGIYNCRPIEGGTTLSVHAEGRALDLSVGDGGTELGDELLDRLLGCAWSLGLQRIIWDRRQYDAHAPSGGPYPGDNPHTDHLHIEQTREAADALSVEEARSALGFDQSEDDVKHLLVQYGSGVVVVAADLSTRTTLAGSADQQALMATGQYVVVGLSASQVARIPIAGHEADDPQPDESGPM